MKTFIKHSTLFAFLVLLGNFPAPLFSQVCFEAEPICSSKAQFSVIVQDGNLYFEPTLLQNSLWSYTWGWEDSFGNTFEGSGYSLSIPLGITSNIYFVRLQVTDGEYFLFTCQKTIDVEQDCILAGFSTSINKCGVEFQPFGVDNLLSSTWDFGDGSDEVNDYMPFYMYSQSGIYNVFHAFVYGNDLDPNYCFVRHCEQPVNLDCTPGNGPGFVYNQIDETCCKLFICFIPDNPSGTHTWDFGDGQTSILANPCHTYSNLSTYPNGTPNISVQHCVTTNNVQQCTIQIIQLGSDPSIFVGTDGVYTSLDGVVSSINGVSLFPGTMIIGDFFNPVVVQVSGELVIDKSFYFEYAGFCMAPGAGLKVNTDQHLDMYASTFLKGEGCNIWRGIDIESSSRFTANTCHIEDALYGLRTLGEGATVEMKFSTFRNNFIGIFAKHTFNLPLFNSVQFEAPLISPLGSLTLDSDIPVPYQTGLGFTGIFVKDATINIPDYGVGNFYRNFFHYISNGIWLEDSDAEIRRCVMLRIMDDTYGEEFSGDGIRFNDISGSHTLRQWGVGLSEASEDSFDECVTGIHVTNHGPNTLVQSQDNKMVEVQKGYVFDVKGNLANQTEVTDNNINCDGVGVEINIENPGMVSHLDINNNSIQVGEFNSLSPGIGIWLNDISGMPIEQSIIVEDNQDIDLFLGRAGIAATNFSGAYIAGNHVNIYPPIQKRKSGIYIDGGNNNDIVCSNILTGFNAPSELPKASIGIFVEESPGNLISENTTENTDLGVRFDMPSISTNKFTCNEMQGHQIGLEYSKTAITGVQINRGNKWPGQWSGGNIGGQHFGENDLIIVASFFRASQFVTPTSGIQWPPPIGADLTPNAPNPWFFPGSLANCSAASNCSIFEPAPGISFVDSTIASTGFTLSYGEGGFNWSTNKYLYRKLTENPNLLQGNALMQSFMAGLDGSTLGLLYDSGTQTSALFEIDSTSQTLLESNFNDILYALNQISIIDSTLAIGVLPAQFDSLTALKLSWQDSIDLAHAQIKPIWDQHLATRAVNATSVATSNDAIITDSLYEANEKSLIALYLETVAKGLPFSLSQMEQLCQTAYQCSLDGGQSVHWARAWYAAKTGELATSFDCDGIIGRSSNDEGDALEPKATTISLLLMPNPAIDVCAIKYAAQSNPAILISDRLGRVVHSEKMDNLSGTFIMDTSSFYPGIYLVQVKVKGEILATEKLVIIK